jgi:hypothetical protein
VALHAVTHAQAGRQTGTRQGAAPPDCPSPHHRRQLAAPTSSYRTVTRRLPCCRSWRTTTAVHQEPTQPASAGSPETCGWGAGQGGSARRRQCRRAGAGAGRRGAGRLARVFPTLDRHHAIVGGYGRRASGPGRPAITHPDGRPSLKLHPLSPALSYEHPMPPLRGVAAMASRCAHNLGGR